MWVGIAEKVYKVKGQSRYLENFYQQDQWTYNGEDKHLTV